VVAECAAAVVVNYVLQGYLRHTVDVDAEENLNIQFIKSN